MNADDFDPPICPHCGGPLTGAGVAIVCFGGGKSGRVRTPGSCPSPECREARDARAVAKLLERGVIDP